MRLRAIIVLILFLVLAAGCSGPEVSGNPEKPTNPDSGWIIQNLQRINRSEQISSFISINYTIDWDHILIAAPYLTEDYVKPHLDLTEKQYKYLEKILVKYQEYLLLLIQDKKIIYVDVLKSIYTDPALLVYDRKAKKILYQTLKERGMDEVLLYSDDPQFRKEFEDTIIKLNMEYRKKLAQEQ